MDRSQDTILNEKGLDVYIYSAALYCCKKSG